MNTDVAIGLGGSLALTNLSGNVPLDLVHESFQREGFNGDLGLQFDELVLEDGLPVTANGSITVNDFFSRYLSAGVDRRLPGRLHLG